LVVIGVHLARISWVQSKAVAEARPIGENWVGRGENWVDFAKRPVPEGPSSDAEPGAGPSLPMASAVAELRANPRFAQALRHTHEGLIGLYDGNRVLNALLNDRGRARMGFLALSLHWSRRVGDPTSGLTVSRLKEICVAQKYCSAGRAEAMIALMRMFGYLEPAPNPHDRRLKVLVPTEKMIAIHVARLRYQFEGMAMLLEEGDLGLRALGNPDFLPRFIRHLAQRNFAGLRVLDPTPELILFAERNSGMMVLFSLLLEPDDDTSKLSVSGLARRFGVSRVHVRKLLNDAARDGLVRRESDEKLVVLPLLRQLGESFVATVYLSHAECIRLVIAELGAQRAVA
jgi:DNA-binding MarR family transcriptional regulator